MIPYGKQAITQDDINAVVEALQSDYITQGDKVPAFEKAVCESVAAKYAVAVNSATSALHIACLALGLDEGDSLWTSPITFVASANCGRLCGANVDFVDIDPKTYNLCPEALEQKLIKAKQNSRLPKIIVVVHLAGQSADMQRIAALAKDYGVNLIEDASHAIGGRYQNSPVGSCEYSDITVFSFHPVKIVTTAEGGIATTNDPLIAKKMQQYRAHGIVKAKEELINKEQGDWYYEQQTLGLNYRMTELQAALGISQLKKLNDFVEKRHDIASRYNKALADLSLILPYQSESAISAFHLYIIRIDKTKTSTTRRQLFDVLRAKDIGVNVHYIPVYKQPYYQALGFDYEYCSEAEIYYETAISLPIYPKLSIQEQQTVVDTMREALTTCA